MSNSEPRRENRLAGETSPYLLQHARNPVDWHPWGAEALERARREDKPILLSIGYSACHWCHVMERESFEDAAIAELMNRHFVCIKVDREERPDLDDVYMAATVSLSGSGGWPMTLFLTPEQEPFFAGTYFPPDDRHGRIGFPRLLRQVAELWTGKRAELLAEAAALADALREQAAQPRPSAIDTTAIGDAVKQLSAVFDLRFGGFGAAPKFPAAPALSLLLRHYRRAQDADALRMVTTTLDGMKNGGIYDHVGGGFARYSTDERWLVPHFEKMLYDNAALGRVYLEAFQVTRNPEYARVARETLDWVLREMQAPEGGYFSATDADSEGEEGKFFVWSPEQITEILGAEQSARFCAFYEISADGNWEGKSIANTPRPPEVVARELGLSEADLVASLASAKAEVYRARSRRVPPLLDDKVLTAWNGLMIGAMAEGFRVLRDRRYLESAERAASAVLSTMTRPDGGLFRTSRAGHAHLDAYLEDYAYLADALVDLHEASGAFEHLDQAARLAVRMLADFGDPSGAFFFTAHGHEKLLARTREGHDGALPNPNAVAARALARLARHLDRSEWRERAVLALRAYGRPIERSPRSFGTALGVVDFLAEPAIELVIAGAPEDPATQALEAELARHFLPGRVVGHVDPSRPVPSRPLTLGKELVDGKPALYVCRDYACRAPVTTPAGVAGALGEHAGEAARAREPVVGASRLPGSATEEGTLARAEKLGGGSGGPGFTLLGSTGLTVSRLGFGGYRVELGDADHRAALAQALCDGVNLIDTSTNYTDGKSEELVGDVLAELVARGELWRDHVVVVSKIGYAQGRNLALAEERERAGQPFPEMVKVGHGIWHCLHPEWLEDQLTRSLDRLGLQTLDVCLLHNPEYFLTDALRRGAGSLATLRDELYRRLEAAFRHLEAEARRGRILWYGVSSNSAVLPAEEREATELGRMLAAARAAGGDYHRFRVLQLPMNLLEPGAALVRNNGEGQVETVLEHARRHGIAVLVNRPLNALVGGGLTRLADPPKLAGAPEHEAAHRRVAELEAEFRERFAPGLRTGPDGPPSDGLFNWAEPLSRLPARAETFAQWTELEREVVLPRLDRVISALDRTLRGEHQAAWVDWRERYLGALHGLLASLRQKATERSRGEAGALHALIDPLLPAERRHEPLSRKALWALRSTEGVTAVLVGMRRGAWVEDALATSSWEPLGEARRVFEAVRSAPTPGRVVVQPVV